MADRQIHVRKRVLPRWKRVPPRVEEGPPSVEEGTSQGTSQGGRGCFQGGRWTFPELFADFSRTFPGLFPDFPRTFPRLSPDFPRTFPGLSPDFPRTFPGLFPNFSRSFSGLFSEFFALRVTPPAHPGPALAPKWPKMAPSWHQIGSKKSIKNGVPHRTLGRSLVGCRTLPKPYQNPSNLGKNRKKTKTRQRTPAAQLALPYLNRKSGQYGSKLASKFE